MPSLEPVKPAAKAPVPKPAAKTAPAAPAAPANNKRVSRDPGDDATASAFRPPPPPTRLVGSFAEAFRGPGGSLAPGHRVVTHAEAVQHLLSGHSYDADEDDEEWEDEGDEDD